MHKILREIFADDKGRLSSTRISNVMVTTFICLFMFVLMCMVPLFINTDPDKEFLATANTASLTQVLFTIVQLAMIAAGLAGATYTAGKMSDNSVLKASMNPDPIPPPPIIPTTIINTGETKGPTGPTGPTGPIAEGELDVATIG